MGREGEFRLMFRVGAICACFVCHMASAQPYPAEVTAGGDTIELRDSGEGQMAEVFYSNSAGLSSQNISRRMTHETRDGPLTIRVTIQVGGKEVNHAEQITVEVVEPDTVIAFPSEAYVMDGETVTIQILRPMF